MKNNIFLATLVFTGFVAIYGQNSFAEIIVNGSTLTRKFEWLSSNAETGKTYVIVLDRNETIPQEQNLDYDGRSITIILRGRGAMREISLVTSASGSLFQVRSGVTLILDNLVTLKGGNNVGGGLVRVGRGGTLIMNEGTGITGNTNGGGVEVDGTFTMNGGAISGNAAFNGGGVLVNGIFTLNGGTISGNSADDGQYTDGRGGGVYVVNGTFAMNGGSISGNRSTWTGGVFLGNDSTFTMTGGSISGNTGETGGVGISGGIFTMTGGSITGNNNSGVSVFRGTFNLNSPATKASISGNTIGNRSEQVGVYDTGNFRVNGLQERGY